MESNRNPVQRVTSTSAATLENNWQEKEDFFFFFFLFRKNQNCSTLIPTFKRFSLSPAFPVWASSSTNQHLDSSKMPGLINKETRSALPLSVSDITSCVRGYSLAMTASMTYENMEDHAIEGEWKKKKPKTTLLIISLCVSVGVLCTGTGCSYLFASLSTLSPCN